MKASAGDALQAELGARVLAHRRAGIEADARDDLARIVLGRQAQLRDFADLDAVVLHQAALDRPVTASVKTMS